jgi:hypothetical protein
MTAQFPEILILDGAECEMTSRPPLPLHDPRLRELSDAEIDARLEQADREHKAAGHAGASRLDWILNSTGCWRRYQGTWEVRDGLLYLVSVEGRFESVGDEPLLADWFTGSLRVPQGKVLLAGSAGATTEEELVIVVTRGQVADRHIADHRWKVSGTAPPIEDPY